MRPGRPHRRRLVPQEAVAGLMHGWLLVLTLANLALANAIVRFVVAVALFLPALAPASRVGVPPPP